MKMWAVIFGVRPRPAHPRYWELESGFLKLFLFAESRDDAAKRAHEIVRNLPYDVSPGVVAGAASEPAAVCDELDLACIENAKWTGLALRICGNPVGEGDPAWGCMELTPKRE